MNFYQNWFFICPMISSVKYSAFPILLGGLGFPDLYLTSADTYGFSQMFCLVCVDLIFHQHSSLTPDVPDSQLSQAKHQN